MTSKELNKIINKTRRTPNISLTPEQAEELINDLEILEILKKYVKYYKLLEDVEAISIELQNKVHKEDFNKIKEWLDNVK